MKKELVFSLSALVMMFSLLLVPSHRAYADDNKITVTGTVADIKANPLQGVAVLVKGERHHYRCGDRRIRKV